MTDSKYAIFLSLGLPIVVLAVIVGMKVFHLSVGTEIRFPISGYDPRDLLSGHYLTFNVEYGIKNICHKNTSKSTVPRRYLCLTNKTAHNSWPKNCTLVLKGQCQYDRFIAGVERYYIPETNAERLDQLVRQGKAEVILSIDASGNALIKDLLINNQSTRQ